MAGALSKAVVVSMLSSYIGVVINTKDEGHEVIRFLRRHPRAEEKLTAKRFVVVEMHPRGYLTVKIDGELVSWRKAMTGKE
jgi:membrane protein implicated in regulation of membrane protease activity